MRYRIQWDAITVTGYLMQQRMDGRLRVSIARSIVYCLSWSIINLIDPGRRGMGIHQFCSPLKVAWSSTRGLVSTESLSR